MLQIWTTVIYLHDECCIHDRLLRILTMSVTYDAKCYLSSRGALHIRTTVTYPHDKCYICWRLLHIWTMSVIYLEDSYNFDDECSIAGQLLHICAMSGTRHLHIFTMNFTYVDDEYYISGRLLHITMMGSIFLDDCYLYGRWVLHILKAVIYLDSNISTRHTSQGHAVLMDWMTLARVPVHFKGMREIALA